MKKAFLSPLVLSIDQKTERQQISVNMVKRNALMRLSITKCLFLRDSKNHSKKTSRIKILDICKSIDDVGFRAKLKGSNATKIQKNLNHIENIQYSAKFLASSL
jgi:hypothetical protein